MEGMSHASIRFHFGLSLFILLCMLPLEGAHASLASCQKKKESAVKACNAALQSAVKDSSANASVVNAACTAKDDKGNLKRGMSNCANDMKNSGALSNSLLDEAIKSCDAQQKSCDSACNPASARQEEKQAVSQLKQQCTKEINASKAQASAGKKGGDDAQKGADETKEASKNDGMPQMPQSQGGGDQGAGSDLSQPQSLGGTNASEQPAAKPAANPAAAFAKSCNYDSAGYDSRCTEALASKCNEDSERNSEMCKTFRTAYCTRGGAAPAGFGENALKPGSGIGSDFCQKSLDAYKNETQSQLKTASTAGAIGGGVAGGGGGGGSGSGASGAAAIAAPDVKGAADESGEYQGKGTMSGGDGGGGGYTYGGANGSGDDGYGGDSAMLNDARRSIAAAEAADQASLPGYKDVQNDYGPNVFSILTGVYRNRCHKGQALHCGTEKK